MKKIALLSLSALFLAGCSLGGGITQPQAKEISAKFVKILAPGAKLEIKSVEKAVGGDFKVVVKAEGQEVTSYLSPDGTTFYPQGLNIAELTKKFEEFKKQQEAAKAVKNPDKSDKDVSNKKQVEVTTDETKQEENSPAEKTEKTEESTTTQK